MIRHVLRVRDWLAIPFFVVRDAIAVSPVFTAALTVFTVALTAYVAYAVVARLAGES